MSADWSHLNGRGQGLSKLRWCMRLSRIRGRWFTCCIGKCSILRMWGRGQYNHHRTRSCSVRARVSRIALIGRRSQKSTGKTWFKRRKPTSRWPANWQTCLKTSATRPKSFVKWSKAVSVSCRTKNSATNSLDSEMRIASCSDSSTYSCTKILFCVMWFKSWFQILITNLVFVFCLVRVHTRRDWVVHLL